MNQHLGRIIERIKDRNPLHYKNIENMLHQQKADFYDSTENFLVKYSKVLEKENKDIDFAVDCYLKMLADITIESVAFLRTGTYSSNSFEEVKKRVYDAPEVMEYYMHGLFLSHFLWNQHYRVYSFFIENLPSYAKAVKDYLEIGSGHGLYISEAINRLAENTRLQVIDISQKSLDMTRAFIGSAKVNYRLCDIFRINEFAQYDFITMGEVLEHVEEPLALLFRVNQLLKPGGAAFITVPANAPAIDHIYLFNNADEIRAMISAAGFSVVNELVIYEKDIPPDKAERNRVSMMYAAFVSKQHHRKGTTNGPGQNHS